MPSQARDLGKKYTCFKCTCKFYDLGRPEPLCPRCGADQREDPNPDPREAFLARFRRPSQAQKAAPVVEEDFEPEMAADEDDSILPPMLDEDDDGAQPLEEDAGPAEEEFEEEN